MPQSVPESASLALEHPAKKTLPFFVAAFAITWLVQLPAVIAPERFIMLGGLGAFGPMLAAIFASKLEGESAKAPFRALKIWRVHPAYYLFALFVPGALFAAGISAYSALTGHDAGPWLYAPLEPPRIAALLIFPFAEEIGWRGFAQPRLQQRYGDLAASAILGVLWCVWHVPMFLMVGLSMTLLPLFILFFLPASYLFVWLSNRTRGSLVLAVLLHAGAHLNNSHRALPDHVDAVVIHTVMYWILAIILLLQSRRRA